MKKIFLLLALYSFTFPLLSQASYPVPEYELIVVESLPETMNLNMSLRQIEDAKHTSQLQKSKSYIYDVLTEKLSPLLSSHAFTQSYNLFEFAKSIPTIDIIDDLIKKQNSISKQETPPAQFMALILPKIPGGSVKKNKLAYSALYSQNKASVIDNPHLGFQPEKSFSDLINEQIINSINFSFNHSYANSTKKEAFFVGALLLINLAGENTSIRIQMIGGLPTDQEFEVNLVQPEANFKYFRFPKTPELRWFSDQLTDYPGVLMTLDYSNQEQEPLMLKVQFGSLSLINENALIAEQAPQDYDSLWVGWKDFAGVIFKRYNVPHLYGTEFAPVGKIVLNDLTRDIQVNIHEVVFDLSKLEVTKMRVFVEFPPKTIWGGWNITHDFLPGIEQPALNEKFKDAVNLQLEPYRNKINLIKGEVEQNGLIGALANPEVNADLMAILNMMLGNSGGQP